MKTSRVPAAMAAGVVFLVAAAALAASSAAELYQEGLTLKTAKGDLEGAIAVFRRVVEEHPQDTAVAASAQLHVGLCYEQLGRQEARAAYERVISGFPGETEVVERARERLRSLEQASEVRRPQTGAGPAKTREMMAALERQRAGVRSYRGTLAVTLEVMGRAIRSEGPMLFRRPGLVRSEMTSSLPTGNTVSVFDGHTSWSWQTAANLVAHIDVAAVKAQDPEYELTNSVFQPFQGLDPESLRYIRTDQVGVDEVYVFQGEPDEVAARTTYGTMVPSWVELAVATRDGLLRKLVGYRDTGVEMMATEATIDELNPAIPDSAFIFVPPAGAQVLDMTETVRSLYAQATAGQPAEPGRTPAVVADVGAVIERLKAARAAVTTYRATGTHQMSVMGAMMTQNVTEWYGGEERSRREMTSSMMPGLTITVQDSGIMWTYMPAMKMVQRLDMKRVKQMQEAETAEEEKPETYEGIRRDSITYVGRESLEGDEVEVLEGPTPKGLAGLAGLDFGRARVWVGAADGLVRRMAIYNGQGEEVSVQTRANVEVNVEIPDSSFTFTPPEGVQVVDMTENAANMVRQAQARMREAGK